MKLKKKKEQRDRCLEDIHTERTKGRKEGERALEVRGGETQRWGRAGRRAWCWSSHQAPGCQHRKGHRPAPDAAAFHEEMWGVVGGRPAAWLLCSPTEPAGFPALNYKPKAGSWEPHGEREKSLIFKRLKNYFRR